MTARSLSRPGHAHAVGLGLGAIATLLVACASPTSAEPGTSTSSTTSGSTTDSSTTSLSGSTTTSTDDGDVTTTALATTSGDATSDTGTVDAPRVLFIGNSYTFVNDLPGLVEAMTAAADLPHVVDSRALAGATVANHVADPQLVPLLAEGWDVVVVQGQSVEPIVDYPGFEAALVELAASVDDASPGAQLLLFETWARAEGSPELDALGMTPEQMQQGLSDGYANAALAVGASVVPVGRSWANAGQDAPAIVLHADDGSHPSLAGSFLATCDFFATLTGAPATSSAWLPDGLPAADADALEAIADATLAE